MTKWISLNPFWNLLHRIAEERDGQKREFASTRQWNECSHFLGICGECIAAIELDLPMNCDLQLLGDGGADFDFGITVDVKACKYFSDPILKVEPEPKHWADFYCLVAIDEENRRGRLCGIASRQEIENAPLRNFGKGRMHHLYERDLKF